MSSFRAHFAVRSLPATLLIATAVAQGAQPLKQDSAATPMCQTIQSWVNSDSRTLSGVSASDVAGSLLGPTFAQAFGKDYSQLTVADFRLLHDQGLASCARTGVLQAGQQQIASTLLNQTYQSRWLRTGGGASTLAPATLAAPGNVAPAQVGNLRATNGQSGGVHALQATQPGATLGNPSQATLRAQPNVAVLTQNPTAPATTAQPQSLKGVGADLKSSFSSALAGMANQAVGAGTQAMSDRMTNLTSGGNSAPAATPAATNSAPACPSAADMEVIRRTGSKPPAGC